MSRRVGFTVAIWVIGIAILHSLGCAGKKAAVQRTPADVAGGRRLYSRYCRSCHGSFELRSTPPEIGGQQEFLFRTVRNGVPDTAMFGYGKMLTDAELTAVVNYLLSILTPGESRK